MKPICILNQKAPARAFSELERQGFDILPLPPHPQLLPGEAAHADMQFCKIPGKALIYAPGTASSVIEVLRNRKISAMQGRTQLKPDYPENIAYNILTVGNLFFHNIPFSDPLAVSLLEANGFSGVKVKQGYAACSAVAMGAREQPLVITGDLGLITAMEDRNIKTVFVPDKDIVLEGFDHGFVGGCCGIYGDKLFTCGEFPKTICSIISGWGISVVPLCDGPLTDIGGILFL